MTVAQIGLDQQTMKQLERLAADRGLTVDDLVAEALDSYLLKGSLN
jgi:hypothetical protein